MHNGMHYNLSGLTMSLEVPLGPRAVETTLHTINPTDILCWMEALADDIYSDIIRIQY